MDERNYLLDNNQQVDSEIRMAPPTPTITRNRYRVLVSIFILFSIIMGYIAATQPSSKGWRFFSYHPLLMTWGFVGRKSYRTLPFTI